MKETEKRHFLHLNMFVFIHDRLVIYQGIESLYINRIWYSSGYVDVKTNNNFDLFYSILISTILVG